MEYLEKSRALMRSIPLLVVNLLDLIVCTIAILALLSLLLPLIRRRIFHTNVTIIFVNLSLANIVYSASRLLRVFDQLWRSTVEQFVVSHQYCRRLLLPSFLPAVVLMNSFLFLAVERTVATLRYRTYEKSRWTSVGFVVVLAQWSLAYFSVPLHRLYQVKPTNSSVNGLLNYCSTLTLSVSLLGRGLVSAAVINLIIESAFIAIFLLILVANRKLRYRQVANLTVTNLGQRFQVDENIRTTWMLSRMSACHALAVLINQAMLLIGANSLRAFEKENEQTPNTTNGSSSFVMNYPLAHLLAYDLSSMLYQLFAIASVVIAARSSAPLRRYYGRYLPGRVVDAMLGSSTSVTVTKAVVGVAAQRGAAQRQSTVILVEPAIEMHDHFQYLNRVWKVQDTAVPSSS